MQQSFATLRQLYLLSKVFFPTAAYLNMSALSQRCIYKNSSHHVHLGGRGGRICMLHPLPLPRYAPEMLRGHSEGVQAREAPHRISLQSGQEILTRHWAQEKSHQNLGCTPPAWQILTFIQTTATRKSRSNLRTIIRSWTWQDSAS